jgi:all-trans-retinol 13,14-reductase
VTLSGVRYRYTRYDGPDTFDAIVVGSGVGGLGTASLLARHRGLRVLVLERHYTIGGFTHTFRRGRYEWDVGVHYVGDVNTATSRIRIMFDNVTAHALEWADMGEVYDTIQVGGRSYRYFAGRERWRSEMHQVFPRERKAIDRYLELLESTFRSRTLFYAEKVIPAWIATVLGPAMRAPFLRRARQTTREVLESLTRSQELIAVLTGQWGDYGLPPAESSFAAHAIVTRHYLEGGAYPIGGPARIAEAIVPTIEASGGRVLCKADVAEILVAAGRTMGVRMCDGKVFRASIVVSDTGVANTVALLPAGAPERDALAAAVVRVGPSMAHLCLYVGLDRSSKDLGLKQSNLWLYPDSDYEACVARFSRDPEAPFPFVYISFPSAKDPSFESRFPGRATINVIAGVPYRQFQSWEHLPWQKRGEEYGQLKEQMAERLLKALRTAVPSVEGHVDRYELSTPITTRHFASYPHGEIYGLAHTPQRFCERLLRPRTAIRGLYLTGQDISVCGVAGALVGAYVTASAIVKKPLFPKSD